jgi:chromosomal replication initiation ATPase DnaA
VLKDSEEEWERRSLFRKRGLDARWLVEKVTCHFGVDSESLKSGSKVPTIAKARAVLCYLGVRKMGLTAASIAKLIFNT